MAVHITGTMGLPSGAVYPNAQMYFERIGVGVISQGGHVVVPEKTIVKSDALAAVDFYLLFGVYQGTIQTTLGDVKFKITVPDVAAEDFGALLGDYTMPIYDENVQLVLDARDDVLAAAGRTFATRAELVSYAALTPITHGLIYEAAGLQYQGFSGATVIADLPGLMPCLPYRAAHHGETDGTVTITLKPTGGQFSTPQAAMNYAAGFSPLDTVTIEQDGTVQGGCELISDCSHVIWKSKTARSVLAYADFTTAYTPDISLPTNDTLNPATNTLFLATKAAIGTMLRGKYSAIVEVPTGNGVELRSHSIQRIEGILFINTGTAQRGLSTGESITAGAGGNTELRGTSWHGFASSGMAMNYGGSIIAYSLAYGLISTFSCNGDTGILSQYAGSSVYAQHAVIYANFQFGCRTKQFGMLYPGQAYVCYNFIDGLSATMGGQFNGLGGTYIGNGGFGVNMYGAGAVAEVSDSTVTGNLGGGIRAQDGAFVLATSAVVNNNGGAGLYAPGGTINAGLAVVTGNVSHASNASEGGRINAVGATLAGSTNGMGARVDGSGEIDCANAVIYGNVNAFSKQVFLNGGGKINITGATDDLAVAITDAACTPLPNIVTDQMGFIKRSSVNSTTALLSSSVAAMAAANGAALANVSPSATVPSILPNKNITTQGIGQGAAGEMALIHTSLTEFAVGAGFARYKGVLRQGTSPGTQVLGAQGAAVANATDAATAISQLNLLLARCRAHGLIAT